MATKKLDLTAPQLTIDLSKGKTFNPIFYYIGDDGSIIDLTGFKATMEVKVDGILDNDWYLTTENGGLTIVQGDVQVGEGLIEEAYGIQAYVSPLITDTTTWSIACYELELIDPTLNILPFVAGSLNLSDHCAI